MLSVNNAFNMPRTPCLIPACQAWVHVVIIKIMPFSNAQLLTVGAHTCKIQCHSKFQFRQHLIPPGSVQGVTG
ncbi:hypothetical protein SDC9_163536 [bioreactor metagenome]|uniref:Uncharacterized protein n=1 Tax=bioreactor metagenome TaxID=1076179 RepID=A0A645FP32_9ZZZZ